MNIMFSRLPFAFTNNFLQSTGHTSPVLIQKIICKSKLLRDKLIIFMNSPGELIAIMDT